jgi:acetamidase/formamidase
MAVEPFADQASAILEGSRQPQLHRLPATPDTVHWGYFDQSLPPRLTIRSGDIVQVETFTHRAGDAPELMMDDEVRAVYEHVHDRGPGPHILTGPIAIEGAEVGDTLEVKVLAMEPRLHHGSNVSTPAGLLYERLGKRRRVTVFELGANLSLARAEFAFDVPATAAGIGSILDAGTARREPALEGVAVPLRPHLGTGGVAPDESGRFSSVPPARWGGNIDNWRFGVGTSMHYPVLVPGALYSAGDPHMAQGDGEINGTAIEASLNVTLQFFIHKDFRLDTQLLVTPTQWMIHAYDEDLNVAMRQAALKMLGFLTTHQGLSPDDAYALMSVAADFTVTQTVDQRRGIHAAIAKSLFVVR